MKFTSSVWSGVSGSIGGTTYGRGPNGGLVARTRTLPSNPNTTPQQNIRAALGVASAAWGGTLTAANRAAWDAYAALTPLTDPLGESITVGGLQMFQRWAALRQLIGESTTQPTLAISGLGQPPTDVSGASMVPLWTTDVDGGASDDGNVFWQVSAKLSGGMNSVKRALTFDVSADIAAAATTVTATPVITIGTGDRIVIRTRLVYDDGRVSQAFTKIVTVTA